MIQFICGSLKRNQYDDNVSHFDSIIERIISFGRANTQIATWDTPNPRYANKHQHVTSAPPSWRHILQSKLTTPAFFPRFFHGFSPGFFLPSLLTLPGFLIPRDSMAILGDSSQDSSQIPKILCDARFILRILNMNQYSPIILWICFRGSYRDC